MVGWPGADRLSRRLSGSTIGAGVFHGRVRDGIGCINSAMGTRPPNHPGRLLGRRGFRWRKVGWISVRIVGFGAAHGVRIIADLNRAGGVVLSLSGD